MIHGTHDEVIPFSNGCDLHHSCHKYHPLPPAWIDGATHNNLETVHSTAYMRAFRSFLQHLLANPPPEPAATKDGWFGWMDNLIPGSPKRKSGLLGGGKDKGGKSSRANSSNNLEKQANGDSAAAGATANGDSGGAAEAGPPGAPVPLS